LPTFSLEPRLKAVEVTSFAAVGNSSYFVRSDGTLWALGANGNGQLGDGTLQNRATAVPVDTGVIEVSGGALHAIYRKADGTLWGMGSNQNGQLGSAAATNQTLPVLIAAGVARAFAGTNSYNTYFFKTDGSFWGLGANHSGQLGAGSSVTTVSVPIEISANVVTAAAGNAHLLLVKTDATLWSLGNGFYGQTGTGSSGNLYAPVQVATEVADVAAGSSFSFFRKADGKLYALGDNTSGQLGLGSTASPQMSPAEVTGGFVASFAGGSTSFHVKADGSLWAAGNNVAGQLGDGTNTLRTAPVHVADGVSAASGGSSHSLFLRRGAPVAPAITEQPQSQSVGANTPAVLTVAATGFPTPHYQWRKGGVDLPGATQTVVRIPLARPEDSGTYEVVVSSVMGSVTSAPATLTVSAPVAPTITAQPVGAFQIVGGTHVLGVTAEGTPPLAYQWYRDGEAVSGATEPVLTLANLQPADAGSYTVVVSNEVSPVTSTAAAVHVELPPVIGSATPNRMIGVPGQPLALSVTASSAYAPLAYQWKKDNRPIPGATGATLTTGAFSNEDAGAYTVEITDAHGFVTRRTTFVLPHYGLTQVIAWGESRYPRPISSIDLPDIVAVSARPGRAYLLRRDGSVLQRDADTGFVSPVAGLSEIVAMAAGIVTDAFLRADGTVTVLGGPSAYDPAPPAGLSGIIALSKGNYHTLALRDDGAVVAWGKNDAGQTDVPAGLTGVTAIAAGGYHNLVLQGDGTVVAWGSNYYGERDVPAGLTGVTRIVAYGSQSYALKADGTVVGWGNPFGGTVGTVSTLVNVRDLAVGSEYAFALLQDGSVQPVAVEPMDGLGPMPDNLAPVVRVSSAYQPMLAVREAAADAAPVITVQPETADRLTHTDLVFTVTATGQGPLYYQWRRNGVELPFGVGATLTLRDLSLADAGDYDVVISSHAGSVTSQVATLTVRPVPEITGQPASRNVVAPGDGLTLGVTATGTGTLAYQWYRDGEALPGATGASLSFASATPADSGCYWVVVTDEIGSSRSALSFVRVRPTYTQVRGWGRNTDAQATVPVGLNDAIAVGAGTSFAAAVRRDGTMVDWGIYQAQPRPAVQDAVEVKVGYRCYIALRANGTVIGYGSGLGGAVVPDGLKDVMAIAAGSTAFAALKADGTVVTWSSTLSVPAETGPIKAVTWVSNTLVVLKTDGTVRYWVSAGAGLPVPGLDQVVEIAGRYARRGDGTVVSLEFGSGTFTPVAGVTEATAISASLGHLLVIRADGSVTAHGNNTYGESVVPADLGLPAMAVAAGEYFSLALIDASTATAPQIVDQPDAQAVTELQSVVFRVIATGGTPLTYQWRKDSQPIAGETRDTLVISSVTASDAGSYDVVIGNYLGEVTSDPASLTVVPVPVVSLATSPRQVLVPGGNLALGVTASGAGTLSYQWRRNGRVIAGATSAQFEVPAVGYADEGYYYVDVTDQNGTRRSAATFVRVAPLAAEVIGWGENTQGRISGAPAEVTDLVALSVAGDYALGLRRDGSIVAWGNTAYVQAGLPAATGFVDLVALSTSCLALRADGTVVAWGQNQSGVLDVPAGLREVVAISANDAVALALRQDGSIAVWGDRAAYRQPPPDLPPAAAVDAKGAFLSAALVDGRVALWDNGTHPFVGQPYLPSLTEIRVVEGAVYTYLTLGQDGVVRAWGSSDLFGTAVLPPGLTAVRSIAAGGRHVLALKTDGTVVGWGSGAAGEVPPEVTGVFALGAGPKVSLALRDASVPTKPFMLLHPLTETVAYGSPLQLAAKAVSTPAPAYQWRKDGVLIDGATSSTWTVPAATFAANGNYDVVVTNSEGSAISSVAAVTVVKASQVIEFTGPPAQAFAPTPITLTATASSGLPVTFTLVSGPAIVSGNQLTLTGAGYITVRATQGGDDNYGPASPVERTFFVEGNFGAWRATQFDATERDDLAVAGPMADPDQDGLTNLIEYALGQDPKSATVAGTPEVATNTSYWLFTFTRPKDRPDLTYTVESSVDLVNWTTVSAANVSEIGGTATTVTIQARQPLTTANVFFRLKVTTP